LLATLLRHSRRLNEAVEELNTIHKFDESVDWTFEIQREQKLIELIAEHEYSQSDGEDDELPNNNDGYVNA
jgi:hypothetical protein